MSRIVKWRKCRFPITRSSLAEALAPTWKLGRVVEGATLEMLLGGNLYESSNLSVSATSIGAAVAQFLDMEEVTGSNPVSTIALAGANALLNLKSAIIAPLLSQYRFMRPALRHTAGSNSGPDIVTLN